MASDPETIDATRVEITHGRWQVRIRVFVLETVVRDFVASADSYYTAGDGIWWGTIDEYREESRNG